MATAQTAPRTHGRVRLDRVLIGVLVLVVIGAAATLFGWNVSGWIKHVWNTIASISLGYLLAAVALITLQTTTTAYAWYSILRFAYPSEGVRWLDVLACYSTAVALNFVLPANLGTLVMLLMYTTLIAACTFAGVVAGYVVQKIFYSAIGVACYVYLFLSVEGTFSLQFGFLGEHPVAAVILIVSVAALLALVARVLRRRITDWWKQAKVGGAILGRPRLYLSRVLLPEFISWLAMLGIIGVFLAAYSIPVSFHTIMRVVAGNSIANMTSVTPGGAGVVQGFNVLSLKGITSSANATAYSVAQQLVTTAWSILFAIVLLARAFGWSDGKTLVARSYSEAREKSAEQTDARKAKREARKESRRRQGTAGAEADGPSPAGPQPGSPGSAPARRTAPAGLGMSGNVPAAVTLRDESSELAATFVPGAGMLCSSLRSAGQELLAQRAGVEEYARCGKTMGIPLLFPWANRLARFRYTAAGRTVEIPHDAGAVSFDGAGLPMHGVIPGRLAWEPTGAGGSWLSARLRWSGPEAELFSVFPFRHDLEYRAALRAGRLEIEITVRACGGDAVPLAFGFHPYLTLPGSPRERWLLELPAMRHLGLDARQIPVGPDVRMPARRMPLGGLDFDDGFDEVAETARFAVGSGERQIELDLLHGYRCAQVYAPASAQLICFEPMAAPANALCSGVGLDVVPSGETRTATFAVGVRGFP